MPHEIQIPRLGWSMEQGTFVGWLKQIGDMIKPGDVLFTLEGEKAIQEIEAVDAGILHFETTFPADGDIVAVGAVIGYLLAIGETAPPIPVRQKPATPTLSATTGPRPSGSDVGQIFNLPALPRQVENLPHGTAPPAASPAVRRLARQLGIDLTQIDSAGRISEADVCRRYLQNRGEFLPNLSTPNTSVVRTPSFERPGTNVRSTTAQAPVPRRGRDLPSVSPRAARTAKQLGIDWSQLTGTGISGRIRERDVRSAASNHADIATPSRADSATSVRLIPITPLRRTIANRMVASLQQTAPVTLTAEIDVTSVVEFREQLNRSGASLVPSITDCFVKLAALALREHPLLNARWQDDAIAINDEVHIGIAVDTTEGLLVPVVRDAHSESMLDIARQSRDLIEKARARRLTANDLQGGTFTITGLGSLGIDGFTPIINFPETAILGLGRIHAQSDAVTTNVALARRVMTLSLTFDHRVLDGAPAARFLQSLARLAASNLQSMFEPTRLG